MEGKTLFLGKGAGGPVDVTWTTGSRLGTVGLPWRPGVGTGPLPTGPTGTGVLEQDG